jgi:endonuclease/exonuclease/phosphatase family metal-dependent hydrolase
VRRLAASVAVALVATASLTPLARPAAAQEAPVRLRVMTFNIWYGATVTHGLDEVVEAIRLADADVVGMQEPYARLRRIALALGYHVSPRMHVISRYPILEPGNSDGDWAYLLLGDGRVAAIMNTHLPATPYTPYRIVNRGFDRDAILEQERRTRLRRIDRELAALAPLVAAGVPVFFTGDFNSPSHRDWTRAAVEARGLPYPVRWPVSLAMENAGFRDSYREAHPDPIADPGFTWTPGYPAPFVNPWDVHDRIDFVWAAGPAATIASALVGESAANADLVVEPWPTDHRGVVSTFDVVPSPMPVLVASAERSRLGNPLEVRFHASGEPGEHLVLRPARSVLAGGDLPTEGTDGAVAFDTAGLAQGAYEVVLFDADGSELARDVVVLVDADQPTVLSVPDDTIEAGRAIEVTWRFAPGNRYDWVGIFPEGVSAKDGPIERWRYTDATIDGSTRIGGRSRGAGAWPLPPGAYEVRLCLDDSYRCRAAATFTVTG